MDIYLLTQIAVGLTIVALLSTLFPLLSSEISRRLFKIKSSTIGETSGPDLNCTEHQNAHGKMESNFQSIYRLPLPQNPYFTGREKYLEELSQSLANEFSGQKIFALVGIGGIGKTQIALQHAHRSENIFRYVWWLHSEDPATLLNDYLGIAEDLKLPKWNLRDIDETIKSIKRWLESESSAKWLLVFDDAQKPDDLVRYLPLTGRGQIVITSRLDVWDGIAKTLFVDVYQRDVTQDESVDFLLKRTGKTDMNGAAAIARELGDLPLALEQAGAYIKVTGISFQDYLDRLKNDQKWLLSQFKPQNYPDPVATIWKISFDAVQKEHPASGDLLNLCAFLAPEGIPRWILEEGRKRLPEPLASCTNDAIDLDKCIAVLKMYSLIYVTNNLISVHRLVQAVAIERMSITIQKKWAGCALMLVNDVFSFSPIYQETWELCSILSPHASYATDHAERLAILPQETANLLDALGNFRHNRMMLLSARSVLERALSIDEKALGPEHPAVARDVNDLGSVLYDLGDLWEARRCFERALQIDEKVLGPDHISVARDFNNLGSVLQARGDLEGAKGCSERALSIDEKALGPEHPAVARDVNDLGSILYDLGDLWAARKCFERALAIDEKALGLEHTRVARDINSLGLALLDQGDFEGARRCFERALSIDEKALGLEHTSVAIRVNNLGLVLKAQGDLEGAKRCFERALAIDEKALGPEHTSVARDVNDLGSVLKDQGDLEGAKRCLERALAIDEKALGPEHTSVARDVNNLGSVLKDQGDLEGAKKYFERALAIDEKALGPEHTSVARDANNLGMVLQDQGDLEGAKRCFERALRIFETRLGKDHPNAVVVRNNLKSLQEKD
jgi:tetratricopeptide (TPR) repeat protein